MRIQLVSDVHTEFHKDHGEGYLSSLDPFGVDVLVVAGDLTTAPHLAGALRSLCKRYPEVVYVTGNHEYYGSDRRTVHQLLADLQAHLPNLHWLEDSTVTLGGQRFVGCTLWFRDDPDGMNEPYSRLLSDFMTIRGLREWVYDVNATSRAWLHEHVRPTDVVVTHHLPHPEAVAPVFRHGRLAPLNRFFLCDMSDLIEAVQPRLWCFGHTHHAVDRSIGDTRLLCNPLGYPHEPDWGYTDDLTVDL